MRLSTRLLVLILVALLPVMAAQVYTQYTLHQQRQSQLGELAMRQAELANGDVASILDGVRQLAAVIAQFPAVRGGGSGCNDRLTALQRSLSAYRFLAIFSDTNVLLCASATAQDTAGGPDWLVRPSNGAELGVGNYTGSPGIDGAFLPITVRLPPLAGGADAPAWFVAALDLHWLARHLEEVKLSRGSLLGNSELLLTDRSGVVIGRFPFATQWIGRKVPPALLPMVTADSPGVTRFTDAGGNTRLAASIPDALPPVGIAAIESLSLPDLMADLQQATLRDMLLLAGSAVLALVLAWLTARRFIYRPTSILLSAAQRWRDGDLGARAAVTEPHSEFGTLAQSFNAMATSLQARELERRLQAELLESQVAERTRALSESNNRLQVEIAEREKTEAALHQAQKLQAIGQLAGGIAHDFNNMLATILGSLELMERRVTPAVASWTENDAERLRTWIARATGAVQRGAQLTSGLLAFSRRQRLSARPTDLNKVIIELVTLATSTLGRRVRVVTELADDLWPAMVDPSQVEAALLNLCLNARDAMPEGGQLTITTANVIQSGQVAPDDPPPGPYVRITVADTGSGMTPDVQSRAFDPFFTTKGHGGSGLGLSQVYSMARQSNGAVRIHSLPDQGTEVALLLPRAASGVEAEPSRAAEAGRRSAPQGVALVVDDDHEVRQVTVEMLKDLGCDVVQAAGGAEALTMLDGLAAPPDLVLLDYAMPGMNGLQLASKLRERGIVAPMALVTGYAELADAEGTAAMLDALLRKPFTIRELEATLARLRRSSGNVVRLRTRERG